MSVAMGDDDTPELDPLPAHDMVGVPGHDDAERLVRLRKALRLRRLGASYDAIADEMGYASGSGVRQFVVSFLQQQAREQAAELRALENDRMDDELRTLNAIRTDTNVKPEVRIRAIEALTRNHARRARLNGLDAPVQVQVSAGALQELDDAIALVESVVLGEVVASHVEPDQRAGSDAEPGQLGPGTDLRPDTAGRSDPAGSS